MIKLNKNVVVNNFLHEEKKEDKDINKKLIKDGALEPLEHEHVENNPESVEKHIEAAKKHADKEKEKSKKLADKIAVKQKAVLFSESLKFKDRTSLTEFLLKLREQKIRRKIVPLHEDAEGYRYEVRYEKPLKESIPSFSELEEWCMNNPVEMLRTIDRIRKDEMTDGDRQIFNDFGLDNYSKKELKQLLDRLENETYSWIYDSGDFDDEQIKKIEKELGESLKEDNNNGPEYNYWFELVKDYLNNRLEDRTSDERLVKATDKDIDDIVNRVVNKILNDDEVWSVIDSAIEYNILHDEFLVDADMKDEDIEEGTKFNNLNEAWDFSDEDNKASEIFAKDLEEDFSFLNTEDKQVLKEEVEKKVETTEETSMWDFGDDE